MHRAARQETVTSASNSGRRALITIFYLELMISNQLVTIILTITNIITGGLAATLGVLRHLEGTKSARRDEYNFAKKFFDELKQEPAMHPFARKKGFQAISRDQNIPFEVIDHLMNIKDPVDALKFYEDSKGYLQHTKVDGKVKIAFKGKSVSAEKKAKNMSYVFMMGASLCYTITFTPWILSAAKLISTSTAFGTTCVIFLPLAYGFVNCLREFTQIRRAMNLLELQSYPIDRPPLAVDEQD